MKVLVVNCGSSSIKYQLFDMDSESVLAAGLVERIGLKGSILTHRPDGNPKFIHKEDIPNHDLGIKLILKTLVDEEHGVLTDIKEIDAVGHRLTHGGEAFSSSVVIDEEVKEIFMSLFPIAPLHNPPQYYGICAVEKALPGVPNVGVFDTAFHATMPAKAYTYSIPHNLAKKYAIRRYGFHGHSHYFVSARAAELLGKAPEETKIITCHLGNGASIAAVDKGHCIDTSMGFTPLEGLPMGTRCGDLDPAIITYLMENERLSPEDMDVILNKKSGMLGISGVSSDFRDVENAAADGNERAELALEVFCYKVAKYVGSYVAAMNGVDAIIFTGGLGENSCTDRLSISNYLTYLGLEIDQEANHVRGIERCITTPDSKVQIWIIPTNEELVIARDTKRLCQ